MNRIKRVALEKLSKEVTEATTPTEKMIYELICKQKDTELFRGILNSAKSLRTAYQYAFSQAKQYQVGGCAVIDDGLLTLWIAHYFKKPVTVVTDDFVKEIMNKNKKKPEELTKPKNINQVKPKKEETKESNSTKDKPKMMEGEQLSLLDLL